MHVKMNRLAHFQVRNVKNWNQSIVGSLAPTVRKSLGVSVDEEGDNQGSFHQKGLHEGEWVGLNGGGYIMVADM